MSADVIEELVALGVRPCALDLAPLAACRGLALLVRFSTWQRHAARGLRLLAMTRALRADGFASGINGDLAARAAAATTGEPAHVAVAWIAKEAEKRARASGPASRASTPGGSSARIETSVRSMRGGSCRASTPAGLRSNIEEWKFGSQATSVPDFQLGTACARAECKAAAEWPSLH